MKYHYFLFFLISTCLFLSCRSYQEKHNFGFEETPQHNGMPKHWSREYFDNSYKITTDYITAYKGKASVRIQSENKGFTEAVVRRIPIDTTGEEFVLKAYLKLQDVGQAGLVFQLADDKGNYIDYDVQMHTVGYTNTSDWQEYTARVPISKKARVLVLGVYLIDKGTVWADHFRLYKDGKLYHFDTILHKPTYEADIDTIEFKNSSGISLQHPTSLQILNVETLCKVWGLMKYYHPAVARGEYNWDFELFRILSNVLQASSTENCNILLEQWVQSYGNIPTYVAKLTDTTRIIKMHADWDWVDEKQLGAPLAELLHLLIQSKKEEDHYYVSYDLKKLPVFTNQNSYPAQVCPDAGYRLLSLFSYWNAIQYFYPYRYLMQKNWHQVLHEMLPKFLNASTETAYHYALLELSAFTYDGNAIMRNTHLLLDPEQKYNRAPYTLELIQNQWVVTNYSGREILPLSTLKKGDIVTKIKGIPVEKWVDSYSPIIPFSNERIRLRNIGYHLLSAADTLIHVEYKRNGRTQEADIRLNGKYILKKAPLLECKMIGHNIGFFDLKTVNNDNLDETLQLFMNTKGIVFDLRKYPLSYNIIFRIAQYLFPQPTPIMNLSLTNLHKPGEFYLTTSLFPMLGSDNPSYYKGKVVALVNNKTQSESEFYAMVLAKAPNAVLMGSQTAGSLGNHNMITVSLPGGVYGLFTGVGFYPTSGKEIQTKGITPDIEVHRTIQGIQQGIDEELEKAVEWINK